MARWCVRCKQQEYRKAFITHRVAIGECGEAIRVAAARACTCASHSFHSRRLLTMPPASHGWRILALVLLAPASHGQQVTQIKCTTVIPDEIYLDFSGATVTNNNLAGVGKLATERWILGNGGISDVSACPDHSCDGNDCTAATSGCTPNPDQTLTVTNVLTDGTNPTNNVDSYAIINTNLRARPLDDGRVVTKAKMVLSIPPGGKHFANGETGNVISESDAGTPTFVSINVDMFKQHTLTAPNGDVMGCEESSLFCKSNFMLSFIDDSPGKETEDPPFKIPIPSMEFTWYDFDMNWSPFWRPPKGFTAKECVYLYQWQRFATTGEFIEQDGWDYNTNNVLNGRYRFFVPYASEGCGTNMLPNYAEAGGVAVWKYDDPAQKCPIVDDDPASPTYTYTTGIAYTSVIAGTPYCFPGNPSPIDGAGNTPTPPTGVRAYWKNQGDDWGAVGSCTAGTDIPAGAGRGDFNTAGYSVWTVRGDVNTILVNGVSTSVTMDHSFTIEYQASCRTHDYTGTVQATGTHHGRPMCYNQPNHPQFTNNNDKAFLAQSLRVKLNFNGIFLAAG